MFACLFLHVKEYVCVSGRGDGTYLFEVEEDGVEAEEKKRNGGREPAKGFTAQGLRVDPRGEREVALGRALLFGRVGRREDERVDGREGDEARDAADGVVEAQRVDQVAQHGRVHDACDAGAARDDAYG